MTIQLIGATRRIAPGTELLYEYVAEENITENELVAKSETTGRVLKAQATTWLRMPAIGIARESKSAGQTIKVEQFGVAENIARDADFNYDDKIFVSTTAGKATSTPPEGVGKIVQSIGRAINSSDIILEIDQTVLELQED
ncbi:hypothetical protein ES703_115784 [subsurface metagenome]